MNGNATQALAMDAIYQILDNWVFRILVVLGGIVVLLSFLFGFREQEIVFLFGMKSWSYASIVPEMQGSGLNMQGAIIDFIVSLIFDQLAGKFGVIFCIAATGFFIPQMIEDHNEGRPVI